MCRGANAKTTGADTGSDGASVASSEAERQAGDSVGDARFNQYRRLKLTTTGRDGDNVALGQRKPRSLSWIERQGVTPDQLRQRLGTFLQPRVVGKRAVPEAGVRPQHQSHGIARRRGSREARKRRLLRRGGDRRVTGNDAVMERVDPPLLEIGVRRRSPGFPNKIISRCIVSSCQ